MLLVAAHAVATSPVMTAYEAYVREVNARPVPEGVQPRDRAWHRRLAALAAAHPVRVPPDASAARVVSALVSFVDDHDGPFAREAFDEEAVVALVAAWRSRPRVDALGLVELVGPRHTLLDAVLVAHAAARQVARGRDTRALPGFAPTLSERLALGASVAPFAHALSRGGDPLGDTYHYLANLAAGLLGASRWSRSWTLPLFAAGPELMWLVRQQIFGAPLFFGNHARVDRLGLRHGVELRRGRQGQM